jgi:dienelactone hydrolase
MIYLAAAWFGAFFGLSAPGDLVQGKEVLLEASDGASVYGTWSGRNHNGIALLFHQAGSNRHEYDPALKWFQEAGLDTLAIDQRSGGTMWERPNETVLKRGKSTSYLSALPDLQAAVDWAKVRGYDQVVVVGSSYSAALVFLLAQKNPKGITAVVSFSPGEYLGGSDVVRKAAAAVKVPVYATAGDSSSEQKRLKTVLPQPGEQVEVYNAKHGVHGASTLRPDRNPKGWEANRQALGAFLKKLPRKT